MKPAQVKPTVSPELLDQIDIRVGTIESVTDVANSKRLIALRVNFGDHVRTVLAGMKRERANPREIEGKQAIFVVNLPPRKIAGMISEAMLFDIGYLDGITRCGGAGIESAGRCYEVYPPACVAHNSHVDRHSGIIAHTQMVRPATREPEQDDDHGTDW
jgi:tRNA-binding protein